MPIIPKNPILNNPNIHHQSVLHGDNIRLSPVLHNVLPVPNDGIYPYVPWPDNKPSPHIHVDTHVKDEEKQVPIHGLDIYPIGVRDTDIDETFTKRWRAADAGLTGLRFNDIETRLANIPVITDLSTLAFTGNVNDLLQTYGDELILDCGTASTNI